MPYWTQAVRLTLNKRIATPTKDQIGNLEDSIKKIFQNVERKKRVAIFENEFKRHGRQSLKCQLLLISIFEEENKRSNRGKRKNK